MFYLKQKYEIVKYMLLILVYGNYVLRVAPYILLYSIFLGNGIAQLRCWNSMNIQRKDVSPLYRFSIFTLKANKFNARHND